MMGTGFEGQVELSGYEGDTPEKFANQMLRWAQGFGDPEIIREACMRSGDAVNWIIGLGRTFTSVDIVPPIWALDAGHEDEALAPRVIFSNEGGEADTGLEGAGNAHFAILEAKVKEFDNVATKVNAEVTHILRNDGGEVIGVEFLNNGEPAFAKAHKAVVLACASVDNNPEMAAQLGLNQQLWGLKMREVGMDDPYCHDMPSNTGDGLRMAMELGASLQLTSACCMPDLHYFGGVSEYYTGMQTGSNPYKGWKNEGTILVNPMGRRFVAEDSCWGYTVTEVAKTLYANGWQPNDPLGKQVYAICDADHFFQWELQGQNVLVEEGGSVIKRDTLEELAEAIGVPADALVEECERWNTYCETGVDTQFDRRVDFGTIKTGPFYADAEKPKVLGTFAGVKSNLKAEVISGATGEPIPRLYAAGTVAGGNYSGPFYFGCGWSILNTVVWGREAGRERRRARELGRQRRRGAARGRGFCGRRPEHRRRRHLDRQGRRHGRRHRGDPRGQGRRAHRGRDRAQQRDPGHRRLRGHRGRHLRRADRGGPGPQDRRHRRRHHHERRGEDRRAARARAGREQVRSRAG